MNNTNGLILRTDFPDPWNLSFSDQPIYEFRHYVLLSLWLLTGTCHIVVSTMAFLCFTMLKDIVNYWLRGVRRSVDQNLDRSHRKALLQDGSDARGEVDEGALFADVRLIIMEA